MSLIINICLHPILNSPLLVKETVHVSYIYWSFYFLQLKPQFLYELSVLWDALDMNNFYFLFLLFSDLIGILFYFSFLLDGEEAHDTAVT